MLTYFHSFSTDYRHHGKQYFSAQLKIKQKTRRIYHKNHSAKLITETRSNNTRSATLLSLSADCTGHKLIHSLTYTTTDYTTNASPWKHGRPCCIPLVAARFGQFFNHDTTGFRENHASPTSTFVSITQPTLVLPHKKIFLVQTPSILCTLYALYLQEFSLHH